MFRFFVKGFVPEFGASAPPPCLVAAEFELAYKLSAPGAMSSPGALLFRNYFELEPRPLGAAFSETLLITKILLFCKIS